MSLWEFFTMAQKLILRPGYCNRQITDVNYFSYMPS